MQIKHESYTFPTQVHVRMFTRRENIQFSKFFPLSSHSSVRRNFLSSFSEVRNFPECVKLTRKFSYLRLEDFFLQISRQLRCVFVEYIYISRTSCQTFNKRSTRTRTKSMNLLASAFKYANKNKFYDLISFIFVSFYDKIT